jgi:DNA-binding protein H-NS
MVKVEQMDINTLNRKELEQLRGDVERALETVSKRELKAARDAAAKAAAEYGYSLAELTEGIASKKGKYGPATRSPAKFANPADPTQTWTGKGRQPNWYRAELEKGTDPSTLEL